MNHTRSAGGSVAEWLACLSQAQKAWVQIATLSGNSLRQTVHTHRASVHQQSVFKRYHSNKHFLRVLPIQDGGKNQLA